MALSAFSNSRNRHFRSRSRIARVVFDTVASASAKLERSIRPVGHQFTQQSRIGGDRRCLSRGEWDAAPGPELRTVIVVDIVPVPEAHRVFTEEVKRLLGIEVQTVIIPL